MLCQNEDHDPGDTPEAVAQISLNVLRDDPDYDGYAVCPPHLIDYVQGIYLDQENAELRLAFTVEPTP